MRLNIQNSLVPSVLFGLALAFLAVPIGESQARDNGTGGQNDPDCQICKDTNAFLIASCAKRERDPGELALCNSQADEIYQQCLIRNRCDPTIWPRPY